MEYVTINGEEYALGCHERTVEPGELRPCLGDAIDLIPQDKWEPADFSAMLPFVGRQGRHGACVGFQCAEALAAAAVIAGAPDPDLTKEATTPATPSPWDLYRKICYGSDNGASIHEALQVLHDRGVATLASVPDFTINSRDSDQVKIEAARRRVLESFDCHDRLAIATAVQCRYPTPLGIAVYENFEQLEEIQGKICVPRPRGRIRGLHCVLGCGLEYVGGIWRAKISTRSWGLNFGDIGCAYYALDWIESKVADAWCVRSVTYSHP